MEKTTIKLVATGVFAFALLLLAVASLEFRVSSLILFFALLYLVTNVVFFLFDRRDAKIQSDKFKACCQKLTETEQKVASQQQSIKTLEQYYSDNKFSDLDEVRSEIEREKRRLQGISLASANLSLGLSAVREEHRQLQEENAKNVTKLRKVKETYNAIADCIERFFSFDPQAAQS